MKQEIREHRTVRINGQEKEIAAEASTSFHDFMTTVAQAVGQDGHVISSLRVDGREISEAEEQNLKNSPVNGMGAIEVMTASPADLAYETLDTLSQYVDRLVASIERAALHFKQKNYVAADTYFVKSIDGLDLFVQTIGGVKLALRVGLEPKIALAEASLVSIMNDLLDAKRQNNYVYIAELLEKDLVENLREWKDVAFPIFRNWKNS